MKTLFIALRTLCVLTVLTGIVYPLVTTGIAQVIFAERANGSLIEAGGGTVGSRLIGQRISSFGYFQGRPSAVGNDAMASGGSNFAVTSRKLRDRVAAQSDRLRRENPDQALPIPAELVLASGSGLDPHLSPQAAHWQIPRVAAARGVDPSRVRGVVDASVQGRDLGVLGEPHVNVLELNLALDRQFGPHRE